MTDRRPAWVGRVAPALGLLLLAPITAEYLYGYDDSTGNAEVLLGGLIVFAPLYGGAALIIREIARRSGRGWPTMLLLGLAFGVAQAGLIDHSLFNPSYRDIDYWDEMFSGTLVPGLGVNLNIALTFTTGHLIWSIAAPIAIVEALVPQRRTTPWLGNLGMALTGVGFVLAATFVLWWHLDTEGFLPSAGHLIGAAVPVIAFTLAAFMVGDRRRPAGDRRSAGPWLVGMSTFAILALPTGGELALEAAGVGWGPWRRAEASWFFVGWPGFGLNLALLAALGMLLVLWSSRGGWGPLHPLAVAGGALLANVATAFATEPIGDVSATAKYTHNALAVLGVVALLAIATRGQRIEPAQEVERPG